MDAVLVPPSVDTSQSIRIVFSPKLARSTAALSERQSTAESPPFYTLLASRSFSAHARIRRPWKHTYSAVISPDHCLEGRRNPLLLRPQMTLVSPKEISTDHFSMFIYISFNFDFPHFLGLSINQAISAHKYSNIENSIMLCIVSN